MAAPEHNLTARDIELIEVALESAASACQHGVTLRTPKSKKLDPLAAEYLAAWRKIAALKPVDA